MEREVQPGDVAMVALSGETYLAFYDAFNEAWVSAKSGRLYPNGLAEIRPLVVIDPEDREQVERVDARWAELMGWIVNDSISVNKRRDHMQTALREFANPTPPKPSEPLGIGAVVQDADENRFIRIGTDAIAPWFSEVPRDKDRPYRYYADITAVKVLSEGVTP